MLRNKGKEASSRHVLDSSCARGSRQAPPCLEMNAETLQYLNIIDGEPSLFQRIDNTVTRMGHSRLKSEICAPMADSIKIQKRFNFIADYEDCNSTAQLREVLKVLPNLDAMQHQVDELILLRGKWLSGGAAEDQAIDETLEGTTAAGLSAADGWNACKDAGLATHSACLNLAADVLRALKALDALAQLRWPGRGRLEELLASKPWNNLRDAIDASVNADYSAVRSMLKDKRALLVADNKDEYLDLARRLYERNTEESTAIRNSVRTGTGRAGFA